MTTSIRSTLGTALMIALALLASLSVGSAHPGHPLAEHGVGHVVTSPYHLALLAGGGVLMVAGAQLVQARLPRRFLRSAGIVALAICAVLWSAGV